MTPLDHVGNAKVLAQLASLDAHEEERCRIALMPGLIEQDLGESRFLCSIVLMSGAVIEFLSQTKRVGLMDLAML